MEVIAITAPIYNEPACYTNTACHFHSANEKILGTLDIGLSAYPLRKTLSLMRSRMILFSFMVLILTIGGVAALLRRHVFDPLREIKEFTSDVNRGNLSGELSGISGELSDLANDVRSVALRLREAILEVRLKGSGSAGVADESAAKRDLREALQVVCHLFWKPNRYRSGNFNHLVLQRITSISMCHSLHPTSYLAPHSGQMRMIL